MKKYIMKIMFVFLIGLVGVQYMYNRDLEWQMVLYKSLYAESDRMLEDMMNVATELRAAANAQPNSGTND